MAFLWDLASLLVLLSSARFEDAHLVAAEGGLSPVVNMKLDPRRKLLTWNYRRNVTWQECKIDTPPKFSTRQRPQARDDTYFCRFPNAVVHRGATLTVTVSADGETFQEVLDFRNSGREGSGAVNFSCLIYDVHLMKCSWRPGPAAPADIQYHLYGWTSRQDREVECPRYIADLRGTHVGCHFDELVGPQLTETYFFWVNGTSQETAVQFVDVSPLKTIEMEKYNPPANITVQYNGSHHIIRWDNPKMRLGMSSGALCYELDIQREVLQRGSEDNVYVMPSSSASAQHTVRARVKFAYSRLWSDWSDALRFGCNFKAPAGGHFRLQDAPVRGLPEQDVSGTPVALVGLVVGVAALVTTVLMFLCTRFSLRGKLFPPVPQVKREVVGTLVPFPEVTWDGHSPPLSLQEPEDILALEEMRPFGSRQAEMVDPAGPHHHSENISPEHRPLDA
ncbi:PREDICTED: granulocyte-macrophage colony-stimulating factor receptor subunit alpha-like [Miniopterus natalensis]|uniref:granulocyte-macrophage colony-stimulating factor receptor subunit alpha-like n=1 Tax=Miniopterus natalensis TaxID=291302 RepID=UPI0007A6BD4E|nr:PREDICTED: granulocyte-macrophage colony-stimulating factor receptor subunit alpha-like [Miniopterus natalensis]